MTTTTILFRDTHIVGQYFLEGEDKEALSTITPGDTITFEHDAANAHDAYAALARLDRTGTKLGYIPKEYSPAVCAFIHAGYRVTGGVTGFTKKNITAYVFCHDLFPDE